MSELFFLLPVGSLRLTCSHRRGLCASACIAPQSIAAACAFPDGEARRLSIPRCRSFLSCSVWDSPPAVSVFSFQGLAGRQPPCQPPIGEQGRRDAGAEGGTSPRFEGSCPAPGFHSISKKNDGEHDSHEKCSWSPREAAAAAASRQPCIRWRLPHRGLVHRLGGWCRPD